MNNAIVTQSSALTRPPVVRGWPGELPAAASNRPPRFDAQAALLVRSARPEDGETVQDFVRGLSMATRYTRFFAPIRELSQSQLERVTHLQPPDELALLAFAEDTVPGRLVAIAQYAVGEDALSREFAIVVGDRSQGRGLGTRLIRELMAHAQQAGFERMQGSVLRSNRAMLSRMDALGFSRVASDDPLLIRVEKRLTQPALHT